MTTLTIRMTEKEKERLRRLALRYGFDLPGFSRRILTEIQTDIPEESVEEYERPAELRASLRRALKDYSVGRVRTKLSTTVR